MVSIQEMQEKDIPTAVSFLKDTTEDFMNQWGGGRWYKYPVTVEQVTSQYKTRNTNTLYFMIMDEEPGYTSVPIGSVELDFIDWEERCCTVCRFIIKKELRSKGYGTHALQALKEYAFNALNMNKVCLSVFDFNAGAIKCYEKSGFTESGRETRDNGWVAIRMEACNPALYDTYSV